MLFGLIGGTGWLLTRQIIDLAAKLPDYQANIDSKLRTIRVPTGRRVRAVHAQRG